MATVISTNIPQGQMYRLLVEFYSRKRKRQITSFSEPSSIRVKIGSYFLGRSFRPVGYAKILIESREKGSNIRFLFDFKLYYIVTFAFEVLAITLLLTKSLPDYLKGQSLFEFALLVMIVLAIILFPYFIIHSVKETQSKFIAEVRKFIKQNTGSGV
ncbi:MAG: hypothetical protein NWF11_03790 [Candidatus Bathyarchaeota archaeon]|nr:hypothetical protein [Candidatus Bathyarchaeota archaeon]